jgi:HAMP domain-containing protein
MKLLAKFSGIFLLLSACALTAAGFLAWQYFEQNAQRDATEEARLMLHTALAMRHYTSAEITPLLDTPEMRKGNFLPQTIPFYAASQGLNALRRQYPDYVYKEATLNPTNLRDRASDWEVDVINNFRNNSEQTEFIGQRNTPSGAALYLARAIRAQTQCLECHGSPQAAPASMTRFYGTANGFGWRANEIVGAQIVSVPISEALSLAHQAFYRLMTYLSASAVVILLLLDISLYFLVIRPVAKLSRAARELSSGKLETPRPRIRGSDEIATLADSFNRVQVSLSKALRMLEANR